MLQMTTRAAELLNQIRSSSEIPNDAGVRVYAEQATDDQVSIGVGFIDNPMPGDQVTEQEGVRLFVAPEVAGPLDRTMIDVAAEDGETQLVFCPQEQIEGPTPA